MSNQVKSGVLNSWLESMLGMVAMLQADMACNAQVVVRARSAGNEVLLGKFCNIQLELNETGSSHGKFLPEMQQLQVRVAIGSSVITDLSLVSERLAFGAIVSVVLLITWPFLTKRLIIQ